MQRLYQDAVSVAERLWDAAHTDGKPDADAGRGIVDSLAQAVAQNRTALLALTALKDYDTSVAEHSAKAEPTPHRRWQCLELECVSFAFQKGSKRGHAIAAADVILVLNQRHHPHRTPSMAPQEVRGQKSEIRIRFFGASF